MRMITRGLAAAFAILVSRHTHAQTLPSVDLHYQTYRATSYNVSGEYYNFSNIRYAAPPLGNLRFTEPIPPQGFNSSIDDGSIGRICPNVQPTWLGVGVQFLNAYIKNEQFDFNAVNASFYATLDTAEPPAQDPRTTEDCLFLDVIVPKKAFDSSIRQTNATGGSPVLVWIYGGGFSYGDKTSYGNPAGLIKASNLTGPNGVVVVLLNYRVGAFGFLAGPTLQANGTVNAGLYDQRLALQWIQSNIRLFGGDPQRVTVMGESAGGSSILFQITAFGGTRGRAPFQQAIIQSPAWTTDLGVLQQEDLMHSFLNLLNVSTIQEARQLDSATLIDANAQLVGDSPYGTFIVDPVVDGIFAPAQPSQLLLSGSFDQSVKVMNGHQINEGVVFTRPFVTDDSSFAALVQFWLPNANASTVSYITGTLYPPVFDGTLPYNDQLHRAILFVSEFVITCHTNWLDRAFHNATYGYQFSVPPGVHAQDTDYTFYNGPGTPDVYQTYNATVAQALQQYILNFTITGSPNGQDNSSAFPVYGNGTLLNLTDAGFPQIPDPTANPRCLYFQLVPDKSTTDYNPSHTAAATNGSEQSGGKSYLGTFLAALVGLMAI